MGDNNNYGPGHPANKLGGRDNNPRYYRGGKVTATPLTIHSDEELEEQFRKLSETIDYIKIGAERLANEATTAKRRMEAIKSYRNKKGAVDNG